MARVGGIKSSRTSTHKLHQKTSILRSLFVALLYWVTMKPKYKYILATLLIITAAALGSYFLSTQKSNTTNSTSLEQRQKEFVEYVDTIN
jgi:hypothetical protein